MGLSNAERQARWRERHKEETAPVLRARLKELEARIQELEAAEAARLKASTAENPRTPQEWAALKEQVRKQRAHDRKLKGAKIAAEAGSELTLEESLARVANLESQLKGLRTQLKNTRDELKGVRHELESVRVDKGMLSKKDRKTLMKTLHPDKWPKATDEEKQRLNHALAIILGLPCDPE
jgi:DNA repair exonuclease SbcCD ATPase subunit